MRFNIVLQGFEKYVGTSMDKLEIEVSLKKPVVPAALTNNGNKMEIGKRFRSDPDWYIQNSDI